MERVFTRINTVHAFRSGPLGPYLQKFAENSSQQGYARESIQVQLRAISRFGRWLKSRRITLRKFQLTDAQVYLRQNGDVRQGDARTLQRFLELLAARSAIVTPQVRKKTKVDVFADKFAEHLKHERGLAPGCWPAIRSSSATAEPVIPLDPTGSKGLRFVGHYY